MAAEPTGAPRDRRRLPPERGTGGNYVPSPWATDTAFAALVRRRRRCSRCAPSRPTDPEPETRPSGCDPRARVLISAIPSGLGEGWSPSDQGFDPARCRLAWGGCVRLDAG
ncbi:hypothetical protein HBB16_02410 [Pseudonocardia sp. MCCB 268]|nr:hypothetical protein [Pseudonocardia cytotoxica]